MSLKTKVGSFQISTGAAGTVQTISGIGFLPKFVKFFWNGRTDAANAIGNGNHFFGTGVAVNAGVSYPNYCVNTKSQNAVSPSNSASDTHEGRCIMMIAAGSNTNAGDATAENYTTDSFDIRIQTQFVIGATIHYVVYGGSDIFAMETLVTTEPVATGTVNMTFGFKPDHLFVIANPAGALSTGIADDSRMMIGAASFRDGAIQQFVNAYGANDNVGTTATQCYNRFDKFLAHIDTNFAGGLTGQANISAIANNVVTLNWTTTSGGGTREHIVLAIKGGSWRVGNFDTVAAGNNIVVSGIGFRPLGVLFVSTTHGGDADGVTTVPCERVMGAVDSAGNQRSLTIESSNGLATTRVSTAIQFDSVYASTNGAAGPAIDARITYTSTQNRGFTLAQPTSDGTGRDVYYIAAGNNAPRGLVPYM